MDKQYYEYLAKQIFQAALEVHKTLGPGLLESVYEFCMMKELELRNIPRDNQVPVPLIYKGYNTGKTFFIDLLVADEIIIEIKSVESLIPVHEAQLISHMKLTNRRMGFLINFNVVLLKEGFKRRVNGY